MQIGALGDIHGAFDTVQEIMTRHQDVPLWVCVGDVASNEGEYFEPPAQCRTSKTPSGANGHQDSAKVALCDWSPFSIQRLDQDAARLLNFLQ